MNIYDKLIHVIEFFTVIVGLVYYKKYKNHSTKYFIWFLVYSWVTCLTGLYTQYLSKEVINMLKDTVFYYPYWHYNFFWSIGNPLFFLFFLYKVTQLLWLKRIVPYVVALFFITTMTYSFVNWNEFFKQNLVFIDLCGFIIIVLCSFSYYIEILKTTKFIFFHKSLSFYAFTSNLFFWLITTPLVFFDEYYHQTDTAFLDLVLPIYVFADVIMFSISIIGIIVSKENLE